MCMLIAVLVATQVALTACLQGGELKTSQRVVVVSDGEVDQISVSDRRSNLKEKEERSRAAVDAQGAIMEVQLQNEELYDEHKSGEGQALCVNNIKHSNTCCASSCGTCGGEGCQDFPGGELQCCRASIARAGRSCANSSDVGCVVPAEVGEMKTQRVMQFGGIHNLDITMQQYNLDGVEGDGVAFQSLDRNISRRPEFIKSMHCTRGKCENCESEESCWHGKPHGGSIHINVPAKSKHDSFVTELWVDCRKSAGKWNAVLPTRGLRNADVAVYVAAYDSAKGKLHKLKVRKKTKGKVQWHIPRASRVSRIHIVLTPRDRSSYATASMMLTLVDPPEGVDTCMGTQVCLKAMGGDISEAGYQLRNDNAKQLMCMQQGHLTNNSEIDESCKHWLACLSRHQVDMDTIKAILVASNPRPKRSPTEASQAQLRERFSNSTSNFSDEAIGECVQPSVDDPESWDCNCGEALIDACAGRNDTAVCFRELFCASDEVCQSWKEDEGECFSSDDDTQPVEHLDSLSMNTFSNTSANASSSASTNNPTYPKELPVGDSLEESLSDKRSC